MSVEPSPDQPTLQEAVSMARTRLERFADDVNAGVAQGGGREFKRKIWGAFADYDALIAAAPAPPSRAPVEAEVREALTAYEIQVLIGTTISGCAMPPEYVFDLKAAWARLYSLGLIDRTDGLANATPKGVAYVAALSPAQHK